MVTIVLDVSWRLFGTMAAQAETASPGIIRKALAIEYCTSISSISDLSESAWALEAEQSDFRASVGFRCLHNVIVGRATAG